MAVGHLYGGCEYFVKGVAGLEFLGCNTGKGKTAASRSWVTQVRVRV